MFKTILNIVEFICVVVLWIEYRKLYKKYTYYKDKSMEPVIHKLKTEEAPVLDTEKRLYAKERFKGIISTFLEEFYGKTYKTITNKRKRDMRLNLIPLLPILQNSNIEIKLTDLTIEEKLEKLKADFNAYTEESDSINIINDILDIIL